MGGNIIIKFAKYLTSSSYRFQINASLGLYNKMPDKEYLKRFFYAKFGYEIDFDNPKTFSEKLQWLKLNNRQTEYTMMADKFQVREYIASLLGEKYLIPLIGVWSNPDEIPFDDLPNQFVLKCNHNSGRGMCICRDKGALDIAKVKKGLAKGLRQDYFLWGREWPYKNIERKIIAEKFISEGDGQGLKDYKFFCFDGYVDCVMVCIDRHLGDTKFYFFDKDWGLLRYNLRGINAPEGFSLPKPKNLELMFEIAHKLSRGLPFARIDLYEVNGQVYFGEITFFPDSGFDKNLLPEVDRYFGELIALPRGGQ